jgi:hypothetical protein
MPSAMTAQLSQRTHNAIGVGAGEYFVEHGRSLSQTPTSTKSESDWIHFVTPRHRRETEIANPQLSGYPGFVGASINDLSIRMYGETGIATSLLSIKENRSGVEEIRKYRVTNVYVNRDNRWQLVSSQLTAYQG